MPGLWIRAAGAAAVLTALMTATTLDPGATSLVDLVSSIAAVALSVLMLVVQVLAGLDALRERRSAVRPVVAVSLAVWGAVLVVSLALEGGVANALGLNDTIDRIAPDGGRAFGWGWGVQVAVVTALGWAGTLIVTGAVVLAVVETVRRVRRRRTAVA